MPLDFPDSPVNGDSYSAAGKTWIYNGTTWVLFGATAEIANGAITTSKISDGSVTEAKIGASAVTADRIASNAVTEAKIDASAVTSAKIAAGAVVEVGIAANAVTTGKLGTDVQLGYRNVVINGAMQIAQRGTSTASITVNGYYTADRWNANLSSLGTWTQSVENDAPTGSGLRKSLKLLCTTADASPAASDLFQMRQEIEGQNLQQFAKGTASAKSFSLSFWVKSNVTGTYVVRLVDRDNSRQVCKSYTISASATWEKKTIDFGADTTGAFDNDNASSMYLGFWLGAGTTYTSGTLQTTWGSTVTADSAVGQTNVAAATNNYWQITGVQLEAGSVATPFEFEDYSTTLAKCQRYYYRITATATTFVADGYNTTTTAGYDIIPFPITMRTSPSALEQNGTAADYGYFYLASSSNFNAVPTFLSANTNYAAVAGSVASGLTAGQGHLFRLTNAGAYLGWSAEL